MILPEGHLDLGTPPRLYYPLVILLIRDNPIMHPDETVSRWHSVTFLVHILFYSCSRSMKMSYLIYFQVALVNVVHIKDSVCTLPTSILAQYLKQANGQLSSLKVCTIIFLAIRMFMMLKILRAFSQSNVHVPTSVI